MKILNINYKIYELEKPNEYMIQNNASGYCDYNQHKIFYLKGSGALTHELIHAYLDAYHRLELSQNEEIVETIESIFKELKKCKKL